MASHRHTTHEHIEIGLTLDSYNDLFSDFDSRGYSERSLSDDFLTEVRKTYGEKHGNKILLKLLMPATLRSADDEKVIVKRIHAHFQNWHKRLKNDSMRTNQKGYAFLALGIVLLLIGSYVSFIKPESFATHSLLVIIEPAGWFMLWNGFDHLVYFARKTRPDRLFAQRMTNAAIDFISQS